MDNFSEDFNTMLFKRTQEPEKIIMSNKKYIEKQNQFNSIKEELNKTLTPKENKLVEDLFIINEEMDTLCNEVYYKTGFVDGVTLRKGTE